MGFGCCANVMRRGPPSRTMQVYSSTTAVGILRAQYKWWVMPTVGEDPNAALGEFFGAPWPKKYENEHEKQT